MTDDFLKITDYTPPVISGHHDGLNWKVEDGLLIVTRAEYAYLPDGSTAQIGERTVTMIPRDALIALMGRIDL